MGAIGEGCKDGFSFSRSGCSSGWSSSPRDSPKLSVNSRCIVSSSIPSLCLSISSGFNLVSSAASFLSS